MTNKERFLQFLAYYEAKDLEAISKMVAEDVVLRDWNLVVHGKEAFLRETGKNFANATTLDIKALSVTENTNTVAGEIVITVDGKDVLWVVDILSFDDRGLINNSRSFLGIPGS